MFVTSCSSIYLSLSASVSSPLLTQKNPVLPVWKSLFSEQGLSLPGTLSPHILPSPLTLCPSGSGQRGGRMQGRETGHLSPVLNALSWVLLSVLASAWGSWVHTYGLLMPGSVLGVQAPFSHFRGACEGEGHKHFGGFPHYIRELWKTHVLGIWTYCYFVILVSY